MYVYSSYLISVCERLTMHLYDMQMEDSLKNRVVGQDHVVTA